MLVWAGLPPELLISTEITNGVCQNPMVMQMSMPPTIQLNLLTAVCPQKVSHQLLGHCMDKANCGLLWTSHNIQEMAIVV